MVVVMKWGPGSSGEGSAEKGDRKNWLHLLDRKGIWVWGFWAILTTYFHSVIAGKRAFKNRLSLSRLVRKGESEPELRPHKYQFRLHPTPQLTTKKSFHSKYE